MGYVLRACSGMTILLAVSDHLHALAAERADLLVTKIDWHLLTCGLC